MQKPTDYSITTITSHKGLLFLEATNTLCLYIVCFSLIGGCWRRYQETSLWVTTPARLMTKGRKLQAC